MVRIYFFKAPMDYYILCSSIMLPNVKLEDQGLKLKAEITIACKRWKCSGNLWYKTSQ